MGLKVEHVTKKFADKVAVDDISFELDKPGVFGLLGTNGAGKTTTIRMILGIMKKDAGEITWNGKEVARKNVNFGYLPEERGIYPKSTIFEQLLYFAKLRGMTKQKAQQEIEYWLEKLEVQEYKNMTAEKLSKGNQQKIQFIIAMLNNPELIILDEPFSGLDPVNRQLIKQVLVELIDQGKYIIMSGHQMEEIEEFCTEIIILNRGKTVLKGNLSNIKDSYPSTKVQVVTKEEIDAIVKGLGLSVLHSREKEYEIAITEEKQGNQLLEELVKQKVAIQKFEFMKPSLQEIFVEKVGEAK